jgi:hypothetical protein
MRRNGWVIVVAALVLSQALFLVTATAAVRTEPKTQDGAAQEPSKEEADAYKAFFEANQAKDPKAMELAKAYLEKYPNGKYSKFLKGFVPRKRAELFNGAMQAKNIGEMIRLGREALAEDANSIDYVYLMLLSIRTNELQATPPSYVHANEATEFGDRLIKLIEADKVPAVIPKDKWNKNVILAWVYQTLAIVEGAGRKNNNKALEYYTKASSLDPSDPYNYLIAGSLLQGKYAEAAKKYQDIPEADRTAPEPQKPEVKAALDAVNKSADDLIDTWARFLALTASKPEYAAQRGQVEKVVTDLYKYRHPETPDGLQKLIEQYKPA